MSVDSPGKALDIMLVVDVVRAEEKLIWRALLQEGLKVAVVNVNQTPLSSEECRARAALIRPVSMYKATYSAAVLESGGCISINSSSSILTCGDKILTYSRLKRSGIPVVESIIAMHSNAALRALLSMKKPLVDKPPIGSWGRMVSLIRDNNDAKTVVEHREMLHCTQEKVHVIQNFIDTGGEDVRCIVVGGECVGCIKRIAGREEWRANVALGGTVEPLSGTEGLELLSELSIKATEAVGAFYAAVDILRSKSEGPLLVNEVNGVPEFKGFMRATGINVGNILVKKILEFIRK